MEKGVLGTSCFCSCFVLNSNNCFQLCSGFRHAAYFHFDPSCFCGGGMADWESETCEGDCPKLSAQGYTRSLNPGFLGPAPSAPRVSICKYLQV